MGLLCSVGAYFTCSRLILPDLVCMDEVGRAEPVSEFTGLSGGVLIVRPLYAVLCKVPV